MNKKIFLLGFVVASIPTLLFFQNFSPADLSATSAQGLVIYTRVHLDNLKSELHPYTEVGGVFELPVEANAKPGSILKNPHRYNACKDLYTPAADARMKTQFFNVQVYGAQGTGVSSPFAKYQNVRTVLQEKAHQNLIQKMYSNPVLKSDDEMDWIGIQSALVAAHLAGGGTVLIPDTGKNYIVNRPIWFYSNVRLVWLTNPGLKSHSYVEPTQATGALGTVFGSYNPYTNSSAHERLTSANSKDHFVGTPTLEQLLKENLYRREAVSFLCKFFMYEPRVIAITGENALGFAKGAYDIQIYGGILKGARYGLKEDVAKGFAEQGGKAVQFESGVQQALVDGTTVLDSTIGLSASAGLYITTRDNPVRYSNAADKITFRNIRMDKVDLPFLLSNLAFYRNDAQAQSLAPQSVLIENFVITNSGLLRIRHPQAHTGQSYYLQSGIFGLLGGTNVTVRNTKGTNNIILNKEHIGALVKGFGRNVEMQNISYTGPISSLLDTHTPLFKVYSSPLMENFRLSSVNLYGDLGFLVRFPSPFLGADKKVYSQRFRNVQLTRIRSTVNPLNGYFSQAFSDLKAAEVRPPNFVYELNGRRGR